MGVSVLLPLATKGAADDVADRVRDLVQSDPTLAAAGLNIAGLPLAEECFGEEMFLQMALFAPLAGLLIFALMFYFFRKLALVIAAMAVAMAVIWTMGLLIGVGIDLHIMATMIPIFLMPIAILDSIHIVSEFFDRYPVHRERVKTLRGVYAEVMMPITYTSLMTAVAFGSLAIAPIPPVQVFGLFVAIGVVIAWLLTLIFIPAFIMMLSEESLQPSGRSQGLTPPAPASPSPYAASAAWRRATVAWHRASFSSLPSPPFRESCSSRSMTTPCAGSRAAAKSGTRPTL
jgi:predicted RND superfamily exporter protein